MWGSLVADTCGCSVLILDVSNVDVCLVGAKSHISSRAQCS